MCVVHVHVRVKLFEALLRYSCMCIVHVHVCVKLFEALLRYSCMCMFHVHRACASCTCMCVGAVPP